MRAEGITLFLGFWIIGVPLSIIFIWGRRKIRCLLTGERYVSEQGIKTLRGKIEGNEYISPEDFALWRKNDRHYFVFGGLKGEYTYEDYLREYNTPPEKREEKRKEIEKIFNTPEFKKIFDGDFFIKKKK